MAVARDFVFEFANTRSSWAMIARAHNSYKGAAMTCRLIRIVAGFAVLLHSIAWAAPPSVPADPAAIAVITRFLEICTRSGDLESLGRDVVAAGLVHASKLDANNPAQLNADSLRFGFKRAAENARLYEPRITRVVQTTTTAVGFGTTAQRGRLFKYFVAKRPGVAGMPAPLHVFFPDQGGSPVLYDWGSL